jgi:hypothetical protein
LRLGDVRSNGASCRTAHLAAPILISSTLISLALISLLPRAGVVTTCVGASSQKREASTAVSTLVGPPTRVKEAATGLS